LARLTVLTPSWRWVAAFIVVAATPLAMGWIQHWLAIQAPGYNGGPGGFGIFVIGAWSMGFALAVVAYVIGILWWHSRKQPHY